MLFLDELDKSFYDAQVAGLTHPYCPECRVKGEQLNGKDWTHDAWHCPQCHNTFWDATRSGLSQESRDVFFETLLDIGWQNSEETDRE